MKAFKIISGLVLWDFGVLIIVANYLPKAGGWSSSNFVEEFINARLHWELAWLAVLGGTLLYAGLAFLLSATRTKEEGSPQV